MFTYTGYIKANKGTILGGVLANRSTDFATREEAIQWTEQALQINKSSGRDVSGEIHTMWNGKVTAKAQV